MKLAVCYRAKNEKIDVVGMIEITVPNMPPGTLLTYDQLLEIQGEIKRRNDGADVVLTFWQEIQ